LGGVGGVVFAEFLRKVEFLEAVGKRLPFLLTSPNAIDPLQTFPAFLSSVWTGAQPFAHTGFCARMRPCGGYRRVLFAFLYALRPGISVPAAWTGRKAEALMRANLLPTTWAETKMDRRRGK